MKIISNQSLYLLILLLSHTAYGTKTESKTYKKPQKKLSRSQLKIKNYTTDFLRIAAKWNPTKKGTEYYEFIVKNRLHASLLNILSLDLEVNIDGKTPLFLAVEDGCKAAQQGKDIKDYLLIIRCFLHNGANVNARNNNNDQTPLHVAAQYQNEQIIKLLRTYKANNSLADQNNNTSFDCAGNNAVIHELLKANFEKEKLPEFTVKDKQANLAREVLMTLPHDNAIAQYKEDEESAPLFIAVKCGMLHHLLALVESKQNLSTINSPLQNQPYNRAYTGMTPLHLAVKLACEHAKKGNQEQYFTYKQIIEVLLTHGAYLNTQTNLKRTPLHIAALHNNQEIIKLLLSYGADKLVEDYQNKTPYELCKNKEAGKALRTFQKSIEKPTFNLKLQHRKLAQEVLQNIPRTKRLAVFKNKKNAEIHIAAFLGAQETLRRAMSKNNLTSLNEKINGETAFVIAFKEYIRLKQLNRIFEAKKRLQTIRFLITRGADITSADKNGDTPLHLAVKNNCPTLIKILLKYQPNILQPNKQGKSALALAAQLKNQTIYRELKEIAIPEKPIQTKKAKNRKLETTVDPTAPLIQTDLAQDIVYTRALYPRPTDELIGPSYDDSFIALDAGKEKTTDVCFDMQNPFGSNPFFNDQEDTDIALDNLPDTQNLVPLSNQFSAKKSNVRQQLLNWE